jgi:hypothetical protein
MNIFLSFDTYINSKKKRMIATLKNFLLLVLFTSILCSCGKSTEELLIGTWSGTDFKFDQTEGPNLASMVEGGKGLHIDGKLILEETGTYIITSPEDRMNGKGTWKVKNDQLIMKGENDKKEVVYDILEISESQLMTSNDVAMESPLGNIAGKITLTYRK